MEIILTISTILLIFCAIHSTIRLKNIKLCNEKLIHTQNSLSEKIYEYETLLNSLPGYIWQKNNEGKIIIANSETCKSLKIQQSEIINKSTFDIFPKQLAEKIDQKEKLILNGISEFIQFEEISPFENDKKIISTRISAIKNKKNEITGIIGIGIDVTKLKKLEEALRHRESYIKIITEIAIKLINIPLAEIDKAIIDTLSAIGEFCMADSAFLASWDVNARATCCSHEWLNMGRGRTTQTMTNMPFDRFHHWADAHLSKGLMFIPNIKELPADDPLTQFLDKQSVKSLIASPLLHDDRCLGFVGLVFTQSKRMAVKKENELLKLISELLINAKLRKEHYIHLIEAKEAADNAYNTVEARIKHRTNQLAMANKLLQKESEEKTIALTKLNLIQNAISMVLIAINSNGIILCWGKATEQIFGIKATNANGALLYDMPIFWDWDIVTNSIKSCTNSGQKTQPFNVKYMRSDGSEGFLILTVNSLPGNEAPGYLILGEDVTEIRILESRLAQSDKFEAIGQLAAGIAHEINTPAQYVNDSVEFLKDYFTDTAPLIDLLMAHFREEFTMEHAPLSKLYSILSNLDLKFYTTEIPSTFDRIFDGMKRIANIVQAMNRFSHNSGSIKTEVNINEVIENTIQISRNEWKYIAEIQTDLDPNLNSITGKANEIGQVLLNIIINATHSISESIQTTSRRGIISIASCNVDGGVKISIQDNGVGIPEGIHDKIFNLFFTTKPLGKGTGQGLAIAYDIVVNKHCGNIYFTSELGANTTFYLFFPLTANLNTQENAYEANYSVCRR